MKEILHEMLKELKIIRKHLGQITKCSFKAGNRFDF